MGPPRRPLPFPLCWAVSMFVGVRWGTSTTGSRVSTLLSRGRTVSRRLRCTARVLGSRWNIRLNVPFVLLLRAWPGHFMRLSADCHRRVTAALSPASRALGRGAGTVRAVRAPLAGRYRLDKADLRQGHGRPVSHRHAHTAVGPGAVPGRRCSAGRAWAGHRPVLNQRAHAGGPAAGSVWAVAQSAGARALLRTHPDPSRILFCAEVLRLTRLFDDSDEGAFARPAPDLFTEARSRRRTSPRTPRCWSHAPPGPAFRPRPPQRRTVRGSDRPHSRCSRAAVRRPAGGAVRRRGHILCQRCATVPPFLHVPACRSDQLQ